MTLEMIKKIKLKLNNSFIKFNKISKPNKLKY